MFNHMFPVCPSIYPPFISHMILILITAWWFQPTPLKNMGSSVGAMTLPIKGHIMKNTLW